MIKRRFYKQDHGDNDGASDSSSSSDSEVEVEEDNNEASASSGYESEDSSANEVELDSSGLVATDDDIDTNGQGDNENSSSDESDKVDSENVVKDKIPSDLPDCIFKNKTVFRCRLCPRIVCLTEETLRAHLKSKRHARSEKLLSEGRLKMMLDSDGEIEGETHQERHASVLAAAAAAAAAAEKPVTLKKKNKGRQRQRKRGKKTELQKTGDGVAVEKTIKLSKKPAKKKRKSDI